MSLPNNCKLSCFQQDCLDAHNKCRKLYCCPPLVLCEFLCTLALDWAEELANHGALRYRPSNEFGENIYMANNVEVTGKQPVRMWFTELAIFDYGECGENLPPDHLLQLVWNKTVSMGVGRVTVGARTWVVVNYHPPCHVKTFMLTMNNAPIHQLVHSEILDAGGLISLFTEKDPKKLMPTKCNNPQEIVDRPRILGDYWLKKLCDDNVAPPSNVTEYCRSVEIDSEGEESQTDIEELLSYLERTSNMNKKKPPKRKVPEEYYLKRNFSARNPKLTIFKRDYTNVAKHVISDSSLENTIPKCKCTKRQLKFIN